MGLIYNLTEQFVHKLWTSVKMNGFYFHFLTYQNESKVSLGQFTLFSFFIFKYVWNNWWDTISTKDHDYLPFCPLVLQIAIAFITVIYFVNLSFPIFFLIPCTSLPLNIYNAAHLDFIYFYNQILAKAN